MKPRWKIIVEMLVGFVILASATISISRAMDGGPAWYWIGIVTAIYAVALISSNWREL